MGRRVAEDRGVLTLLRENMSKTGFSIPFGVNKGTETMNICYSPVSQRAWLR